MLWIQSLVLLLPMVTEPPEVPINEENEFGYYYGEFMTYGMEDTHPMSRLITDRLAESVFQSEDKDTLQARLRLLKKSSSDYPELVTRFAKLDERMQRSFTTRVTKAKSNKLLYTAAGALIGAVIGLPVGKLIATHTTLGMRVLWITVPAGAIAGGGAGYLLSDLLERPEKVQSSDLLSKDLQTIEAELSH